MARKLESGVPTWTSPGHLTVTGDGYFGWFGNDGRYHGIGGSKIPQSTLDEAGSILGFRGGEDPYAEMMEMMAHQMEMQAEMQGQYMQQMSLLQEEQLRMQEQAARAAMIEDEKSPSDFSQANADDTARKKLLRRGLMSTFTRYGNAGGGAKATKMGG